MNAPFEADPLLSNRIRTGVLAYLSDRGAADFTELAAALELANNTLSSHLQRLEGAGYIELGRGFLGRKPRTRIILTPTGRAAWAAHLDRLG
ncbi:transcriptional regulator [Brevundimonas goettingensis]|uniref:Transcriptional regulator n=1 Tax=Brevundimonas goettingensis TaxID=2774190 RepID=A0A975BZT6_9CAUL|nr:transcriptional regulator [Brevundimonas goettingensis]QTC90167.1 transcriptional regulator [Brevundimonas goettingensis]